MTGTVDFTKNLDTTVLKGKCALVTGGASGIGAKTVALLAGNGALVTIADINAELGETYVAELSLQGSRVQFVHTDVTSWSSQINAFKSAIEFAGVGTIDIVVAVAGILGKPFELFKEEQPSLERDPHLPTTVERVIDTNLKGSYFTSQLAPYYFGLPSTSGEESTVRKSLTLFGSVVSYYDFPHSPDYSASKWATRGLFRAIRTPMEQQGYRVNLIAPGITDTPLLGDLKAFFVQSGFPIGDPKDVAETVVRCAADDAICGRAICAGPSKIFDLNDDPEGLDGAEFKKHLESEGKLF